MNEKGAQQCEKGISPILYLTAASTSLYLGRQGCDVFPRVQIKSYA